MEEATTLPVPALAWRKAYRALGYLGIMSIFGALLSGFQASPAASWDSAWINLGLYALFMGPHLVMTRAWWKRAVWGDPAGKPSERRFYILVTLACWWAVLALQRPLPALEVALPPVVRFAGLLAFLVCFLGFFHGITFAMIDALLGVPGSVSGYTHGAETPLFTEGAYAEVRHPMYRSALLAGLASLLVHPSLTQVFWVALIGGTFLAFIPVEEAQLVRARGEDYLRYRERTPWRLFRGIW